jgi:hypothetical protein
MKTISIKLTNQQYFKLMKEADRYKTTPSNMARVKVAIGSPPK